MRAASWVQPSPLGPVAVTTSAAGLRLLDLPGPRPVLAVENDGVAATVGGEPVVEVAAALAGYFAGDLRAVDALPVDLSALTPFSQAVLTTLREVPAGALTSYGRLAAAAGSPAAARAVGRALGANPVAIVVPCHRVVAGDGSLGGFGGGLDMKRWLLAHEGHAVASMEKGPARAGATRRRAAG
ncbi:MAG: methylated-DNA--[protein]-cysteine S-methyltransferase [Acidimicrobiales bacterium]